MILKQEIENMIFGEVGYAECINCNNFNKLEKKCNYKNLNCALQTDKNYFELNESISDKLAERIINTICEKLQEEKET